MTARPWTIRIAQASDVNFIYSTFLKSLKHDSILGRSVSGAIFFEEYQKIADHILGDSKTIVACDPSDPLIMYGYLIYSPGIIHFAFTKQAFWRRGIATSLYESADRDAGPFHFMTHKTRMATEALWPKLKLTFNPFKLYQQTKETEK